MQTIISAKAMRQENHLTSLAEMESLTEVSMSQYTVNSFKIVKDQEAWCSVRKLQAMYNSAEQMTFNCHTVNGAFVPEYNSKETVVLLRWGSRSRKFAIISNELIRVKLLT